MTTTDELRRLLDERGVEWWQSANTLGCVFTRWYSPLFGDEVCAMENGEEGLVLFDHYLTPAQAIEATLGRGVTGDTSDGYHTFNELYHHRAVLFSVIVRMMPDKAWKSKLHYTGDMFDGMFIVGIDTPTGQATYHYDIDPYWEMFDCKELERAPEWDGHTPNQAIERIATLGRGECRKKPSKGGYFFFCSECGYNITGGWAIYCPHCGRRVVEG